MTQPNNKTKRVGLQVVTTSGVWPDGAYSPAGHDDVLETHLEAAASALGIVDTAGWIAFADEHELDRSRSIKDNKLKGCLIDIDFGPREGGGGRE